jgi:hypothetical protein
LLERKVAKLKAARRLGAQVWLNLHKNADLLQLLFHLIAFLIPYHWRIVKLDEIKASTILTAHVLGLLEKNVFDIRNYMNASYSLACH